MGPADSRRRRFALMFSCTRWVPPTSTGLPDHWRNLSVRAVPNHPGRPGGCTRPLLHPRFKASSPWGAWPPATWRFKAESGSLALRLAPSPREASPAGLLRRLLPWLHVNGQFPWRPPFRSQDRPGLAWRTRLRRFHTQQDFSPPNGRPPVHSEPIGVAGLHPVEFQQRTIRDMVNSSVRRSRTN